MATPGIVEVTTMPDGSRYRGEIKFVPQDDFYFHGKGRLT